MNNKKKVLGFVCLGLILVSVIMVSAGWKDLFTFGDDSDLEGELPESAQANVEVSGTQNPPQVVFVSNVTDPNAGVDCGGETNGGCVEAGGSETWSFYFLAYSEAGASFVNYGNATVEVSHNSDADNTDDFHTDTSCSKSGTVDGTGYGYSGTDLANFSCGVEMQYYDDEGDWNITALVEDDNTPSKIGINDSKTFYVHFVNDYDIDPNSVNWTGVSAGGSAKNATNNINVINQGNNDIDPGSSPLNITGYKLNGTTDSSKYIPAENFGVEDGGRTSCNQGHLGSQVLVEGNQITVDSFSISHQDSNGGAANEDLTFCLNTTYDISTQSYSTLENNWSINVAFDSSY